MEPYPKLVRDRIIGLYEQGKGTKEIAELFGLCRSGVRRVRQRFRERGTTDPLPRDPGRGPGLSEAERERLREMVRATPDATLAELHAGLGAGVAVSTIDRWLSRLGLPRKKKTRRASEQRDRPDVRQAREEWPAKVAGIPLADFVLVDEFGATTAMARTHGRAPPGERVVGYVPGGHYKQVSTIAAMAAGGVVASATFDGATDAGTFVAFVGEALVPALRPGQVVILDNLKAHKDPAVERLIEAAGCRLLPLPPYSPDFNPIEMAFAKVKAILRSIAERTVQGLFGAIGRALAAVTPDDALGFICHCYPHCRPAT